MLTYLLLPNIFFSHFAYITTHILSFLKPIGQSWILEIHRVICVSYREKKITRASLTQLELILP